MKISDLERKLEEIRRERGDIEILKRQNVVGGMGDTPFVYSAPTVELADHPNAIRGTRVAVVIIK